jgi:hypothetical protein
MPMLMMHVRQMGMRVRESCMPMLMHVGFTRRVLWPMRMLMMVIMSVSVRMSHWFVIVDMLVALGSVKPYPKTHQCTGNKQRERDGLAECENRRSRAKKGGG